MLTPANAENNSQNNVEHRLEYVSPQSLLTITLRRPNPIAGDGAFIKKHPIEPTVNEVQFGTPMDY